MTCNKCGATLKETDKFCPICGNPVASDTGNPNTRYCIECGKEISVYAKVCPFCYTIQKKKPKRPSNPDLEKLTAEPEESSNSNDPSASSETNGTDEEKTSPFDTAPEESEDLQTDNQESLSPTEFFDRHKKLLIRMLISLGITVAMLFVGLFVYKHFIYKPTINLNRYIKMEVNGSNGSGTAEMHYLEDEFMADYGGKIRYTGDRNSIEDVSLRNEDDALIFFRACVHGTLDRDSGLSNGDIVTFQWRFDDENAEKNYRIHVKHHDQQIQVSELDE